METPQELNVRVCELFVGGWGSRGRNRVGVKFSGRNIWPKIGTRGRGTKKGWLKIPPYPKRIHILQEGVPQAWVSDPLPGAERFFRASGCFSLGRGKKLLNNKTPEEHGERPARRIYTNQAAC